MLCDSLGALLINLSLFIMDKKQTNPLDSYYDEKAATEWLACWHHNQDDMGLLYAHCLKLGFFNHFQVTWDYQTRFFLKKGLGGSMTQARWCHYEHFFAPLQAGSENKSPPKKAY